MARVGAQRQAQEKPEEKPGAEPVPSDMAKTPIKEIKIYEHEIADDDPGIRQLKKTNLFNKRKKEWTPGMAGFWTDAYKIMAYDGQQNLVGTVAVDKAGMITFAYIMPEYKDAAVKPQLFLAVLQIVMEKQHKTVVMDRKEARVLVDPAFIAKLHARNNLKVIWVDKNRSRFRFEWNWDPETMQTILKDAGMEGIIQPLVSPPAFAAAEKPEAPAAETQPVKEKAPAEEGPIESGKGVEAETPAESITSLRQWHQQVAEAKDGIEGQKQVLLQTANKLNRKALRPVMDKLWSQGAGERDPELDQLRRLPGEIRCLMISVYLLGPNVAPEKYQEAIPEAYQSLVGQLESYGWIDDSRKLRDDFNPETSSDQGWEIILRHIQSRSKKHLPRKIAYKIGGRFKENLAFLEEVRKLEWTLDISFSAAVVGQMLFTTHDETFLKELLNLSPELKNQKVLEKLIQLPYGMTKIKKYWDQLKSATEPDEVREILSQEEVEGTIVEPEQQQPEAGTPAQPITSFGQWCQQVAAVTGGIEEQKQAVKQTAPNLNREALSPVMDKLWSQGAGKDDPELAHLRELPGQIRYLMVSAYLNSDYDDVPAAYQTMVGQLETYGWIDDSRKLRDDFKQSSSRAKKKAFNIILNHLQSQPGQRLLDEREYYIRDSYLKNLAFLEEVRKLEWTSTSSITFLPDVIVRCVFTSRDQQSMTTLLNLAPHLENQQVLLELFIKLPLEIPSREELLEKFGNVNDPSEVQKILKTGRPATVKEKKPSFSGQDKRRFLQENPFLNSREQSWDDGMHILAKQSEKLNIPNDPEFNARVLIKRGFKKTENGGQWPWLNAFYASWEQLLPAPMRTVYGSLMSRVAAPVITEGAVLLFLAWGTGLPWWGLQLIWQVLHIDWRHWRGLKQAWRETTRRHLLILSALTAGAMVLISIFYPLSPWWVYIAVFSFNHFMVNLLGQGQQIDQPLAAGESLSYAPLRHWQRTLVKALLFKGPSFKNVKLGQTLPGLLNRPVTMVRLLLWAALMGMRINPEPEQSPFSKVDLLRWQGSVGLRQFLDTGAVFTPRIKPLGDLPGNRWSQLWQWVQGRAWRKEGNQVTFYLPQVLMPRAGKSPSPLTGLAMEMLFEQEDRSHAVEGLEQPSLVVTLTQQLLADPVLRPYYHHQEKAWQRLDKVLVTLMAAQSPEQINIYWGSMLLREISELRGRTADNKLESALLHQLMLVKGTKVSLLMDGQVRPVKLPKLLFEEQRLYNQFHRLYPQVEAPLLPRPLLWRVQRLAGAV